MVTNAFSSFDHPSAPMKPFDNYIRTVSPWDDPSDVWLSDQWTASNGCQLDDRHNTTGLGCDHHSTLGRLKCGGQTGLSNRMYDAVNVFAAAIHQLVVDYCPDALQHKEKLKSCISGPRLLGYLLNTSTDGYVGRISFDLNEMKMELE